MSEQQSGTALDYYLQDQKLQQAYKQNIENNGYAENPRTGYDLWVDKRVAEMQAEKANPVYQKEQERLLASNNAKAFGDALNATKQVTSMTHNGNNVIQNQDGTYWADDGTNKYQISDPSTIQKKYDMNPDIAIAQGLAKGDASLMAAFNERIKPTNHTRSPEDIEAAALRKEDRANEEYNRREDDRYEKSSKPAQIEALVKSLKFDELPDDQKSMLVNELNNADSKEERDAISSIATTNMFRPSFKEYAKFIGEGAATGAATGAGIGTVAGGIMGASVPFFLGPQLKEDKFTTAMNSYKEKKAKSKSKK